MKSGTTNFKAFNLIAPLQRKWLEKTFFAVIEMIEKIVLIIFEGSEFSRSPFTRTKFKYDWMIVACAASRGVQKIYTDDIDILRCAAKVGIQAIAQKVLMVPAESRQLRIPDSE